MKKDLNIHLPKTSFPMRAHLPQKEPEWIQFWSQNKIHQKMQKKDKPAFHFVDGPPYANGRIHLGTALNKVLKDILVKQAGMAGYSCPFIPIWDCHGLPIELKALKKVKSGASPKEVRQACKKEALRWVDIQEKQFQRLGVLADWENKWLTMDSSYCAQEIKFLALLVEKDLLYRGKRPIHWCTKLKTAAAASEVEYFPHKSPAIDVKFQITNTSLFPEKSFAVIWTTTPWTLPANQAIALHPDLSYGLYKNEKEYLLIAEPLKDSFEKRTGLSLKLEKTFQGQQLEHIPYRHPFTNETFKIILGSHVTTEAGTGCVHTAPGHGTDDFIIGKKYSLKTFCPVDESGRFTHEVPEFKDLHVFKANPLIIEKLKNSSHLIHHEEIEHSYPYNPRSKSPLIFRITPQWFINFSSKTQPIRKKALELIQKEIQFVPDWSRNRMQSMIDTSPDWCLSRQRVWGVPLPVFYCKSCFHPLLRASLMKKIAEKIEHLGIQYYFDTPEEQLLDSGTKCEKCQHTHFKKGEDILDVWFDSGICHSVFKKRIGAFPVDVYLEGSDQHRGWFQTSLNSAVAAYQKSPFKTLITHGFVYDLEKRKMSKSLGNIIDPEDIVKKYGAEILRLWASACDYSQDISSGEEVLQRTMESYRRFRNTIRFLIGNLYDFEFEKDGLPVQDMNLIDQWILSRLTVLSESIQKDYQNFEFHKVYQSLNKFFTSELSSLYLDVIKDRLYTFKGRQRRSAQTALHFLLKNLIQLMAPITSFLSEEAYQHLKGPKEESVFLTTFEKLDWHKPLLEEKMNVLLQVRQIVTKEIETMRNKKTIGSSLEAHTALTLPTDDYKVFSEHKDYAQELFIVSSLSLTEGEFSVLITKAQGKKCCRCWHYHQLLNEDEICPKCVQNL